MASKNKAKFSNTAPANKPRQIPAANMQGVSARGWKVIGIGIAVVAVGFFVLSLTDPGGQNWASTVSPFLLLGGYATIAFGIVTPAKKKDTP